MSKEDKWEDLLEDKWFTLILWVDGKILHLFLSLLWNLIAFAGGLKLQLLDLGQSHSAY